jgi:hypothetical protein
LEQNNKFREKFLERDFVETQVSISISVSNWRVTKYSLIAEIFSAVIFIEIILAQVGCSKIISIFSLRRTEIFKRLTGSLRVMFQALTKGENQIFHFSYKLNFFSMKAKKTS